MENRSGLAPLGRAVLVELYEPEQQRGLIAIPDHVRERTAMVEQRAVVVSVGPEAWSDERKPRAVPGDKVLITRFAGHMARGPLDKRLYRMVNANDIFCAITAEADLEAVDERSASHG